MTLPVSRSPMWRPGATASHGRSWVTEPRMKSSRRKSTESTRLLPSRGCPTCYCNLGIIKGKSRIENQGKNRKCINERQCRVNIIYDRKHRHIRIFDRLNVREQRKRCSKNNHSNHESAKKPAHYPYDKRKALQSKQRTCSWKKPMRYLRRQRLLASYGQSSPLLPQNILASLPQRRNLSANVGTNPSVV